MFAKVRRKRQTTHPKLKDVRGKYRKLEMQSNWRSPQATAATLRWTQSKLKKHLEQQWKGWLKVYTHDRGKIKGGIRGIKEFGGFCNTFYPLVFLVINLPIYQDTPGSLCHNLDPSSAS